MMIHEQILTSLCENPDDVDVILNAFDANAVNMNDNERFHSLITAMNDSDDIDFTVSNTY